MANGAGYSAASDTMMRFFLSQISVRITAIEARRVLVDPDKQIVAEIKKGIEALQTPPPVAGKPAGNTGIDGTEDAAWSEAYRLERLLALLEPTENLLQELARRLDEAATEQVGAEPRLRANFRIVEAKAFDVTKNPPLFRQEVEPQLRAMLMDILEETHWTFQRKFFSRPIMKVAIKKIIWLGLASFVLLLLPFLLLFVTNDLNNKIEVKDWTWLALYMALSAGLFGAFFSRLIDIQRNGDRMSLGELKNAQQFSSLFLRGAVGMCGALVVFFFLQSGIVNGSLFPNFDQIGFKQVKVDLIGKGEAGPDSDSPVPPPPAPPAGAQANVPPLDETPKPDVAQTDPVLVLVLPTGSLALLVIWCFLAGFSERLVPTILSSTEGRLTSASQGTG